MGEILGIGVTHYPGIMVPDENMADILKRTLKSDKIPAAAKEITGWPEAMQQEWNRELESAKEHRSRLVESFRKVREEIEDFKPDFILIFGDDQFENFKEEIIPPFGVYIMDNLDFRPLSHNEGFSMTKENIWGYPPDKLFHAKGHRSGANYLVRKLLEQGVDIPYSYKTRHEGLLSHSFAQTIVFLDYDQQRPLEIPIVPFHVNCYGSRIISSKGGTGHFESDFDLDPPSPMPHRCFDVGRAVGKIIADSPWRVAIVASSSWSHAFLCEKTGWVYPDLEADRARFEELKIGEYAKWRELNIKDVEDSGQHEILNWICLAGAMSELNYKVEIIDYIETYLFNSNKCFAIFRP